jgi:predicted glutamine amidotransferase
MEKRKLSVCRFFGFLGSAPAKVDWHLARAGNSLLAQSRRDRAGDSHRDGWGIGYYVGGFPIVAWSASPAPDDGKFLIVAHSVCAHAVIAHVRDASVGVPALANTHPFTYGRWLFAHNGTVRQFDRVAPTLINEIPPALLTWRRGDTDSELVFYWLLAHLIRAGLDVTQPCADSTALSEIIAAAVKELGRRCDQAEADGEPSRLNLLLTDGSILLATRWRHSLYWSERRSSPLRSAFTSNAKDRRGIVVVSEPIDEEPWQEVADHSLLTVDSSLQVSVRAL